MGLMLGPHTRRSAASRLDEENYSRGNIIPTSESGSVLSVASCSTASKRQSGSLERAGGIGGLLARSHDFEVCTNMLTYWLTNNSGFCISNLAVWDDSQVYASDVYIDSGDVWTFSWAASPGTLYHVRGDSCDPYYIQVYSDESFSGTLSTRRSHFTGGDD